MTINCHLLNVVNANQAGALCTKFTLTLFFSIKRRGPSPLTYRSYRHSMASELFCAVFRSVRATPPPPPFGVWHKLVHIHVHPHSLRCAADRKFFPLPGSFITTQPGPAPLFYCSSFAAVTALRGRNLICGDAASETWFGT